MNCFKLFGTKGSLVWSIVQYSFFLQDSWGPLMSHISGFHDHVMVVVLMILTVVVYINMVVFFFPCYSRFMKSSEGLETLWTILPCMVLASLAAPSLMTLYLSDELSNPVVTLKVIGHQWYWSYEYEDLSSSSFDSYMIPTCDLLKGDFRLLEVDKSVKVPLNSESRVFVTSSDVIHSWTVPCLGVKVDAIPGRLNQLSLYPSRVGLAYGQCSEICGSMHSFMPICLEVVPQEEFFRWLWSS
uniref:Cytochrome c oxidase subunit 2 n=1 Tax=Campanulotes compar TaxID=135595 RepID=Q2HJL3_9NEOP|nr:cytochrome c oxidase subunit II [Campanulotes compar]UTT72570.1 cytochrome c oxidase subunit 2 [Campanulotes compar]